ATTRSRGCRSPTTARPAGSSSAWRASWAWPSSSRSRPASSPPPCARPPAARRPHRPPDERAHPRKTTEGEPWSAEGEPWSASVDEHAAPGAPALPLLGLALPDQPDLDDPAEAGVGMPRPVGLEPVARVEAPRARVLLGHPDLCRPGRDDDVEQGLSRPRPVVLGQHVQGVQLDVPHRRVAADFPRRAADAEPDHRVVHLRDDDPASARRSLRPEPALPRRGAFLEGGGLPE